jgi:hypothetical protein
LGYRIGWHYAVTQSGGGAPDGTLDSNDPWYYFCYDDRWRPVATYRASDSSPKERVVYHNAGASDEVRHVPSVATNTAPLRAKARVPRVRTQATITVTEQPIPFEHARPRTVASVVQLHDPPVKTRKKVSMSASVPTSPSPFWSAVWHVEQQTPS